MVQFIGKPQSALGGFLEKAGPGLDQLAESLGIRRENKELGISPSVKSPKARQMLLENKYAQQEQLQKNKLLDDYLNTIPEDQLSKREKDLIKISMQGTGPAGIAGQLSKPPPAEKKAPPTPLEKSKAAIEAKKYSEAVDQVGKIDSTLDNINYLRQLAPKLRGITGYGKAALKTKDASEFNSIGLSLIEPILKIFNPVGAIPIAKINLIRSQFAPKASDLASTIQGKLNALERIAQQGKARAEERIALYESYEGTPPPEEVKKFEKETERELDKLTRQSKKEVASISQEAEKEETIPFDAAENRGRTIENPETGQRFTSDGVKWNPT
ncbi:hypothetical protein UFOVP80_15 [uncultured Caudovirales phage]|uniref:Uncharacterized protein n=1 Tax=uncultured Caudovirales phage TaxID=2100421 RepID=A0A6J5KZX3_9CAUD|nr:hypothetical protein UFOVP80_15 [uncultured Caudovirales phage]